MKILKLLGVDYADTKKYSVETEGKLEIIGGIPKRSLYRDSRKEEKGGFGGDNKDGKNK